MLMFAREVHNLRYFRLCDFIGVDPAFANAIIMNMQHNLYRFFWRFIKKTSQDDDDKFLRRIIIIQQKYTIHIWPANLRLRPRYQSRRAVIAVYGVS